MTASLRPLNSGPYATYEEFDRVFTRADKALKRETSTTEALSMGFSIPVHGEFMRYKVSPELRPKDGFSLQDKYLYGLQFPLNFDPLWNGMPLGKPVQGYGHNLVGSPNYPQPNWPILVPQPRPRYNHPEDDEYGRPRNRIY